MDDDLRHPDAGKTSKTFNEAASGREPDAPSVQQPKRSKQKHDHVPSGPQDGPTITMEGADSVRRTSHQERQNALDKAAKAHVDADTPDPERPVPGEHKGETLRARFERQAAQRSSSATKDGPGIRDGEQKDEALATKFNRQAER